MAGKVAFAVVKLAEWQSWQPTWVNKWPPMTWEAVVVAGTGGGEHPDEGGEVDGVRGHVRGIAGRPAVQHDVRGVLQGSVERAAGDDGGVLIGREALAAEEFVADALLDAVGLAGEHQQRLVLRLPAEPRDGLGVAVVVEPAADPEGRPPRGGGGEVRPQGGVRGELDQAQAEQRRRDAEGEVAARELPGEVELRDRGAGRVRPALDREEVRDAAVGQSREGVGDLAHLADRPAQAQDAGEVGGVGGTVQVGEVPGDHGVDHGTRPAGGRIGVTLGAAIAVEARPQADALLAGDRPGDGVHFPEAVLGGGIVRLVRRVPLGVRAVEDGVGAARARRPAPDAGVLNALFVRIAEKWAAEGGDREDTNEGAGGHEKSEGLGTYFHVIAGFLSWPTDSPRSHPHKHTSI